VAEEYPFLDERRQTDLRASLLVMRLALAIAEYEGRATKERDFRLAVRLLSRREAPLCVSSEPDPEAMIG
jgi:hypothetical protein